jgi:Protein of unknown function (DUF1579)
MNVQILVRSTLVLALGLSLAGAAGAQDMPLPQPGPEHQLFQMDAGTWDAKVEMYMAPGAPPMVSQGTEVNTIGCGGLCVISDFKSTMAGAPFHGHGTATWDPTKKKYVGTWTDSMSTGISMSESTYDPATKTMTGWMEGPDTTGKITKSKAVVEYKDANTRIFSAYMTSPDGKEVPMMKISYTKKP